MPGCRYCTDDDDNWEYKSFDYGFGQLGNYALDVSIDSKGLLIEMHRSRDSADIIKTRLEDVKYCPFCGRKLGD